MFDKTKIGYSFPPFTFDIERAKIRELALAIGDENPVYQSRQAAQATSYDDVPLPPTAFTMFLFWGNPHFFQQLTELGINVTRLLHLEEQYEYLAPIHPGDTLTGVITVLDGKTRRGQDGSSTDIVTLEIRYTTQQGRPVLIARSTFVIRE